MALVGLAFLSIATLLGVSLARELRMCRMVRQWSEQDARRIAEFIGKDGQ
jgi:hypothetical protein